MEGITGYLILALGSSLVLLRFVALSEKSGKPISNSLTKKGQPRHPNRNSASEAVKALGNPGNWEQRLNNKVLSVTGETDMMDLVDAVHSIDREEARYENLERIVAVIVKEKEFRWKKEIYQQVIDVVLTFYGHRRRNLLKKIALWIAGNGDVPWAVEVAMSIPAKNIRNNVLKEIRQRTEKQ